MIGDIHMNIMDWKRFTQIVQDDDDEIREEYIGRHRVHFLGHHLPVPVLKVMTRNDDADAREKGEVFIMVMMAVIIRWHPKSHVAGHMLQQM